MTPPISAALRGSTSTAMSCLVFATAAAITVAAVRPADLAAQRAPAIAAVPASATTAVRATGTLASYTARFAGVGAEGVDMLWEGTVAGAATGAVNLRVEYLGEEMDRARQQWPVRAWLFVAADNPAHSFAAELTGTIDWRDGTARLDGTISEGWMRGARVEHDGLLDDFDARGTLRVVTPLALAGAGR
jgi:hypothetical protein